MTVKEQFDQNFEIQNEGTICLLRPLTDWATDWLETNIHENAQWFGTAVVVEPRYLSDIVDGICEDLP